MSKNNPHRARCIDLAKNIGASTGVPEQDECWGEKETTTRFEKLQ